jgi:hypothetical protein
MFLAVALVLFIADENLAHGYIHTKRTIVTKWVIIDAPEVTIYVDGNGVPYRTHFPTILAPTSSSAPAVVLASLDSSTPIPQIVNLVPNPFPSALLVPVPLEIAPQAPQAPQLVTTLALSSYEVSVPSLVAPVPNPSTTPVPSQAAIAPISMEVVPGTGKYASSGLQRSNGYGIS